jgi:membrane-associated phospholipid phosphatase
VQATNARVDRSHSLGLVRGYGRRLTFPATRDAVSGLLSRWPFLRVLAWIPGVLVMSLPYIAVRGFADDTGIPSSELALRVDRLFGGGVTLSERLQDWLFRGELSSLDWFWLYVHASWFVLPSVITGYVVIRHWPLFGSLVTARIGVLYLGLIGFLLLPTAPPWMESDVTRLLDLQAGSVLDVDTNPLAAMPSLHVALPAAVALWARAIGWRGWAWVYGVQSVLTAFGVVYLGEHYLLDVVAGLVVALIAVRLARPCSPRAPSAADGDERFHQSGR